MMLIIVLLLAACSPSMTSPAPMQVSSDSMQVPGSVEAENSTNSIIDVLQSSERIVLRNASLQIISADVEVSVLEIARLAENATGWVVSSQTRFVQETANATITIRVPAALFTDILAQIRAHALSVQFENITGQDVTSEYTDLTSQVTNLQAAEVQLRSFLEDAATTEDVLSVYSELVRIRGEIETTQGRINYYNDAAAYSAIVVELSVTPTTNMVSDWNLLQTADDAFQTLLRVLRFSVNGAIWLIIFALPIALIFVLIYRVIRPLILSLFRPRRPPAPK